MSKKTDKPTKIATALSITAGQYIVNLAPNQPWVVGLGAFVTLLSGASEIAGILFDDIDIQKLKTQIEKNPDDARLFWSIIDAGLREAAEEKIKLYNAYLKGAFEDTEIAKESNSKMLLIIQQVTMKELKIFQMVYKNFGDLQILNFIHAVNSKNMELKKVYASNELENWLDSFIAENRKAISKDDYLKDIRFFSRGFNMIDFRKHILFADYEIKNELNMLAGYGLFQSNEAMGGTLYRTTDFGEYMFKFIENNK